MANKQIATYLNDHLAGSIAALELLEYLEAAHAGTPLERFFAELQKEVDADRQELEALMSRLQVDQSRIRQATAWVGEKLTQLKLRVDDSAGGALRLLEALEVLSLGIAGKEAMWQAMRVVAEKAPQLQRADYEGLVKRAEEQRHRVEVERLEVAKKALLPATL
jgi:hypothetical protein